MVWQDIVITICSILFGYSLIPQVYYGFKKKKGTITLQTSIITMLGLLVMAFTYFTMHLYFSAGLAIIMSLLWSLLLFQKIKYK